MRCSTLAPVYSPDHGKVPNDQRTWVRRPAVSFEGTAPTKNDAIARWKDNWPLFRNARTEAEWDQLAEDQNRSRKQNLRYDNLAIRGRLSVETRADVETELAAEGPSPAWLLQLLGHQNP